MLQHEKRSGDKRSCVAFATYGSDRRTTVEFALPTVGVVGGVGEKVLLSESLDGAANPLFSSMEIKECFHTLTH
jgi:hypothetical protein